MNHPMETVSASRFHRLTIRCLLGELDGPIYCLCDSYRLHWLDAGIEPPPSGTPVEDALAVLTRAQSSALIQHLRRAVEADCVRSQRS